MTTSHQTLTHGPSLVQRVRYLARRLLQNPIASFVLAGVLLLDAATLPEAGIRGPGSTVGSFMTYEVRGKSAPTIFRGTKTIYFLREDSQLRLIDTDTDSWDEVSRLMKRSPQHLLIASYKVSTLESGFWAVTGKKESHTIEFEFPPGSFTQEETGRARQMFADYNVSRFGPGYEPQAAFIRGGDTFSSLRLWRGYVHNAAAAVLGLTLLYSLMWVPRTPAWFRFRRGQRRMRRGQCPQCGYNTRGLREPRCPECGSETGASVVPTQ